MVITSTLHAEGRQFKSGRKQFLAFIFLSLFLLHFTTNNWSQVRREWAYKGNHSNRSQSICVLTPPKNKWQQSRPQHWGLRPPLFRKQWYEPRADSSWSIAVSILASHVGDRVSILRWGGGFFSPSAIVFVNFVVNSDAEETFNKWQCKTRRPRRFRCVNRESIVNCKPMMAEELAKIVL